MVRSNKDFGFYGRDLVPTPCLIHGFSVKLPVVKGYKAQVKQQLEVFFRHSTQGFIFNARSSESKVTLYDQTQCIRTSAA